MSAPNHFPASNAARVAHVTQFWTGLLEYGPILGPETYSGNSDACYFLVQTSASRVYKKHMKQAKRSRVLGRATVWPSIVVRPSAAHWYPRHHSKAQEGNPGLYQFWHGATVESCGLVTGVIAPSPTPMGVSLLLVPMVK